MRQQNGAGEVGVKFSGKQQSQLLCAVLPITFLCSACSIPNVKELETGGNSFAKDSVREIGEHWDSQLFVQRAASNLAAAGDPSPLFKVFAEKLGPIRKIKEVHRENFQQFFGITFNRPDYVALHKCSIECELGPATVLVGVAHLNNKWQLSSFNVDSESLKEVNKEEVADAKKYAGELAPKICANLNVDFLKEHAAPGLKAELKDNLQTVAANGLFMAVGKALGKFKRCEELKSNGWMFVEGKYAYKFSGEAQFERGKAAINLIVVKFDGRWKLRGFNIKSHS